MAFSSTEQVTAYNRAYYQAHKAECDARTRAWHEANKDQQSIRDKARRAANREQNIVAIRDRGYSGIPLEEYDEMLEAQGGVCAICGKTPEENGKRLAVDRDHETGTIIRDLLCSDCSLVLGVLGDNLERCDALAEYLRGWGHGFQ